MRIVSVLLLLVTAVLAPLTAQTGCGSCSGMSCGTAACPLEGSSFDVRLPSLSGDTVNLAELLARSPVAILQLGPGAASDSAARVLERWMIQDNSIPAMGSLCTRDKKVRKHVAGLKLGFPVVLDPDGVLLALCKTTDCDPVLVFIDQTGSIVMNATSVSLEVLDQGVQVLAAAGNATDPVCGMSIDKATAAATSEFAGETYYFCNQACKTKFDRDPKAFISGE